MLNRSRRLGASRLVSFQLNRSNTCAINLVGEEGLDVTELVVDHECQHAHLSRTTLVQFDGTFVKLSLFVEGVPAEVKEIVAEVTNEFSSSDVLHDGKLQESNEKEDLEGTRNGDVKRGIPAVSKVRELGSVIGDLSRKVDTGSIDQVTNNTEHTDTSVLDFNVSEAVELLLVSIGNESKGIPESKRWLGSKLILEGLQGGGGCGLLGWSERSRGGDKGSKDSGLHLDDCSNKEDCENNRE